MNKEKNIECSKIKKIVCPICGTLCLTKAKYCPKCGEPLQYEATQK
ncbi:MAG: hypothetical protein ACQERB_14410 [Promethearchaeati archaeon]